LEATKASLEEAVENRAREEKSGEVVGKWKNALDSSAQEKIQTEDVRGARGARNIRREERKVG